MLVRDQQGNLNRMLKSINPKVSTQNSNRVKPFERFEAPRDLSTDERKAIIVATFAMGNSLFFDETKPNPKPGFVHSYSLRFIILDNYLTSKTSKELAKVSEKLDSLEIGVKLRA